MDDPTHETATVSHVTVSIELELELDYEGLSEQEIRDRCHADKAQIIEAVYAGSKPSLPPCLRAFRFEEGGGGEWFPNRK